MGIKGFEIDFEQDGLYYDPEYGPNYWNYYFKPCLVGSQNHCKIQHIRTDFPDPKLFPQNVLDKFAGHAVIQKYVHLNDSLAGASHSNFSNSML